MMKKLMFAALAGASMVAVAAPASATVYVLNGGGAINVPPTYTENVNPANLGVGSFQDEFRFTLGTTFTMSSGTFTTTAAGGAGNLDFGVVQLRSGLGNGGAVIATFTNTGNPSGTEFSFLNDQMLAAGSYTVVVNGNVQTAPASYGGAFTFAQAAVPEPATWGMMILGFGLIGAASRRSRKVSSVLA